MADAYRRHAVIKAPVEDVWSIVSDPQTHPDWWPELRDVQLAGVAGGAGEYTRFTRRFGFLDLIDTTWVAEPREHMKEVNFRCTASGTYTRFVLTPAQEDTFVEVEAGVAPIGIHGRIMQAAGPLFFRRWLGDLLDALPQVVLRTKQPS